MKRWLAGLLLAALLLAVMPPASQAEAAEPLGGEEMRLHGYADYTLPLSTLYLDPHLGPGYRYPWADFEAPAGTPVKILTQARDGEGRLWILMESDVLGAPRRAYLLCGTAEERCLDCDLAGIPEEPRELISAWACMPYEEEALRWGPGEQYGLTGDRMDPDGAAWVVLMNGEWALVECTDEFSENRGDVPYCTRGWVRFSALVY